MFGGIVALVGVALFAPAGRRSADSEDRFRIVCTFLPNYVFALNVAGDVPGVEVEMMVPPNVGCPHDYALSARDRMTVESADVIVANGLGVEGFAEQLLAMRGEQVIVLSKDCELIERQDYGVEHAAASTSPGDRSGPVHGDDEGHEHEAGEAAGQAHAYEENGEEDHAHPHDHDHGHEAPWNPHVWVSVKEAITQVRALAEELGERDPEHAEAYAANAKAYLERLGALQREVVELKGRFTHTNIVTLHDAFDYLARDLGLNVVTTLERLPGVAPATGDLRAIIEKIRTQRVAAIFTEPAYSDRLAQTIGRETGVQVVPLDPFTSTKEKIEAGA
jgi:ABC-type Zn uptake system ZnuABC Zn-binding protein ZnuA